MTRRFVSPDPLGVSSGLNQFRFANGDPINGGDPSGKDYYVENCSASVMASVTWTSGGQPITIFGPVSYCDFSQIADSLLPDGVYFGCRPLGSVPADLLYGHCGIQTVEGDDIMTYQLIPSGLLGGDNTFPGETPNDAQFNWILVPGTDLQSALAVDQATLVVETEFSNQPYPVLGVFGVFGPASNSNTFACTLAATAGVQIPANFFTAPSPLSNRSYPLLTKGQCVNFSPAAPFANP